jgi:GTP pyrophosphokinase
MQTLLKTELEKRQENLKIMEKSLSQTLKQQSIKFLEVKGRVKRPYSLFKKIQKYQGEIAKIYDIIALRIITRSTADCYSALGAIHEHYKPVPGRIKDYISSPKPNGYQSLHTTVFCKNDMIFEIQIRTDLMDESSERAESIQAVAKPASEYLSMPRSFRLLT